MLVGVTWLEYTICEEGLSAFAMNNTNLSQKEMGVEPLE